jgi:hypothetical protein
MLQGRQVAPRTPHAWTEVPGWHTIDESQHPAAQVIVLQPSGFTPPPPVPAPPPVPPPAAPPAAPPAVAPVHVPPMHCSEAPHARHMLPLEPQRICVGACTHIVPSQQPLQLAGPHVVAVTHWPPKQLWAAPHCWQIPASLPHARFVFPITQPPPSGITQPGHRNSIQAPMTLQAFPIA